MHVIAKRGHYEFPPADLPAFLIDAGIDINAAADDAFPLGARCGSAWAR
jgi:hypothetical protein